MSLLVGGLASLTGPGATAATRKPDPLLLVDYHLISKTPVSNSKLYDYVYRVDVKNTTLDTLYDVLGSVTSRRKSVQVLDGQASFGTVEPQKVKASSDTIAVRAHKYFDRRLDRKVTRGGRLVFEEDGIDPEDTRIPGWPAKWVSIIQEMLDNLFRLKGTWIFDWTFTFKQDQGGPVITGQSPTGNVASDRPAIRASYQDPSGIKTASVKLVVDGADVTVGSQVTASAVSFTPATALGQGPHAVALSVADLAGNASSANWSFSVDSLPPVVSGQSPRDTQGASPRSTISAQLADSGTGIDVGRTVLIVDDQDVTARATITAAGVTYTPPTPLSNGAHGVTLRVVDQAGNQTEAAWSFGVDGTGPDITGTSPRDVTLAADAIPTVAATFSDSSAGVDVASARMFLDGVDVTLGAQVTAAGVSYSPAQPLAERLHAVRVTVQDLSGNASEAQWGFTTRTDPEITSPSPKDTIVGASAPTVIAAHYHDVGSGIDPAAVKLLVDDVDVTPQAQVGPAAVSFTPAAALGEGLHLVTLTVADRAGNAVSETWRFTTDSGLPVVTAASPRNELISDTTPAITATYQDSPNGSGIDVTEVRLSVDGVDVTTRAQVTDTQVAYTPTPSEALGDGSHTVTVRVVDNARNSVVSSWSFQVDAAAPEILEPAPSDTVLPADALPEISARFADRGAAGIDPESIHLFVDDADVTRDAVVDGGRISWSQPLAEGAHRVQLTVADALANTTTASWGFVTRSLPVISGQTPKDIFVPVTEAPAVSAAFSDVGSGIDPARTSLVVDGVDVTAQSVLGAAGVQYAAASPWAAGLHVVALTVFDLAGNRADASWQFRSISTPEIFDTTPSGVVLPVGSQPSISARFRDSGASIDLARVRLLVDESDVTSLAQVTPHSVSFTPAAALASGPHAVYLSVENSVGITAQTTWGFDVDTPSVRSMAILSPAASVTTPDVEVAVSVASNKAVVTSVTVNGLDTFPAVGASGLVHTVRLRLRPGSNEIRAEARFDDDEVRTATANVDYDAPPEVAIESPRDLDVLGAVATTSPRDLSGNVERPTTITGRLSKPVATVTVNQQQAVTAGLAFRFENFFLHEGTNVVTAVATDSLGRTGTTTVTVSVDQTAPMVSVEAPVEKAMTSSAKVDVRGVVNDAVEGFANQPYPTVAVTNAANGATVVGKVADRSFIAEDVPLEVGANELKAVATDHVGNRRERLVTVTRIAVGSDRLTALSGNRQRGAINAPLTKPIQVIAIDRSGNPLPGLPITFDVTRGTGLLRSEPDVSAQDLPGRSLVISTDGTGRAGAYLTLGKQSGEAGNVVRASNPSLAEDVVFTATGERGMPAFIRADFGSNQYAEAGSRTIEPLSAVVTDADENRVAGAPVAFRVDDGDATFENGQSEIVVTTDRNGVAAARTTVGSTPGLVRASARVFDPTGPSTVVGAVYLVTALEQADGPTQFSGKVLDHKGTPLAGVRVSLGRTPLSATTDADGNFRFDDQVPPGKLDVFIDGRTITQGDLQYPALHFEATAVRGRLNQLPHPISLPPLLMSEAKVVGGDSDVTLRIPGFEGFEMIVKANSVTFPDGSKVGPLVVSPVHQDKLPMVPPGGYSGFMAPAWTIQPSGTRFDPPIQVKVPNTIGLKPGETREIFQWDHDLATFVAMGRATVTEDASLLVTDVGSGISKAGWGGPPNPPPDPPKCSTPSLVCQDCRTFDSAPDVCACVKDKGQNGAKCESDGGVFGGTVFCGKCSGGVCNQDSTVDEGDCCGGRKIDRDKECCAKIVANGHARKIVDGTKSLMLNGLVPDQCPDRVQRQRWPPGGLNDVKIDGCSVPGPLQSLFAPGLFVQFLWDARLPTAHPLAELFYTACGEGHDRCYQTCGSDKSQCDSALRDDLTAGCNAIPLVEFYRGAGGPDAQVYTHPMRTACLNFTQSVYYGVALGGHGPYGDRQKQTCKCCPNSAPEYVDPTDEARDP